MKKNSNYREIVRNGFFYKNLDNFTQEIFPNLKMILSEKLNIICQEQDFSKPLTFIDLYKIHTWEQCTQWILEIDFNDYEWSYNNMKPHFFGFVIMLEEIPKKRELHFSCSFSNSFSNFATRIDSKITEDEFNNSAFLINKLDEIKSFFDLYSKKALSELDKIEYDKLELL